MGNQPGKTHNSRDIYKRTLNGKNSIGIPHSPSKPELVTNHVIASDAVTIRWYYPNDENVLLQGYIVEHRRIGSQQWMRACNILIPNNELTINGLDPGWKYQFRVIAVTSLGNSYPSEYSEPLSVMLQRKTTSTAPYFVVELENKEVLLHNPVEFKVDFNGNPSPEIVWYKDGFELLDDEHNKIFVDYEMGCSMLQIENVISSDEGEFKCLATNSMGQAETNAKLIIDDPPKVLLSKNYDDGLLAEAGEVLRLKVSIEGRPAPTVIWTHNNKMITSVDRFEIITTKTSSNLRISNVQREDRGEYTVKALNRSGEDSKSFLVTVTSRPSSPGKAIVSKCIGNSATVHFTEPEDDGGCTVCNYIIEYNRTGWDVWLKAKTTKNLTVTLNNLIEGSEYKFRVKAENLYGISEPGEESFLVFVPDISRGVFSPPRSHNNSTSNLFQSNLLKSRSVSRSRSATRENVSKVDSETSTRPDEGCKSPVKIKISEPEVEIEETMEIVEIKKPVQRFEIEKPVQRFEIEKPVEPVEVEESVKTVEIEKPNETNFDFENDKTSEPPFKSISAPDLGTTIENPSLRQTVSSTYLMYEKVMRDLYQTLEQREETEKSEEMFNKKKLPSLDAFNFERRHTIANTGKDHNLEIEKFEDYSSSTIDDQLSDERLDEKVRSSSFSNEINNNNNTWNGKMDSEKEVYDSKDEKSNEDLRSIVSPYKTPNKGEAVLVLNKPQQSDPQFVLKPILKGSGMNSKLSSAKTSKETLPTEEPNFINKINNSPMYSTPNQNTGRSERIQDFINTRKTSDSSIKDQRRQESTEENRTVIDHYTSILSDKKFYSRRSSADKVPLYLRPSIDAESESEEEEKEVNPPKEQSLSPINWDYKPKTVFEKDSSRRSIKDKFSAKIVLRSTSKSPHRSELKTNEIHQRKLSSSSNQPNLNLKDNLAEKKLDSKKDKLNGSLEITVVTKKQVKSNLYYLIDVSLFMFSIYLYLFKNELLCIPILLLLVYRQFKTK